MNETKRVPLFQCMECGKKFYSVAAARRAAFGDRGCPKCGGVDIDVYVLARGPEGELVATGQRL